jgi:hypothetical protein
MTQPETQYVSVGDGDVAYQVVGDAPKDLLFCYGMGSHRAHQANPRRRLVFRHACGFVPPDHVRSAGHRRI